MNTIVKELDVGEGKVHVGLATMSDNAHKELALKDGNNQAAIKKIVDALTWRSGMTHSHAALELINNEFFSKKGGQREKAAHVLVFITDGGSSDNKSTIQAADKLKKAGVLIIAVGVGKNVHEDELNQIATGKEFVVRVQNFQQVNFSFIKSKIIEPVNCKLEIV